MPLLLALTLISCASSRIISSWKSPDPITGDLKRILVVSIPGDAKTNFYEKMEQHLAADLKTQGFEAIMAREQFGEKGLEGIDEKEALEMIAGKNFDAVLTIVLMDKKNEQIFVPAHYRNQGPSGDGWWDYINSRSQEVHQRGYYEASTKYFWQSNLFELRTNKLIFSCNTESVDPLTATALGHEYGIMISQEIASKGIIPIFPKKPF